MAIRPKKNTKETTNIDQVTDVERNRVFSMIAYLWIFCVIPLVARRESPYAQFHAKQGVVLAITWFLLWIIGIVPILGWLIFIIGAPLLLAVNLLAFIKAGQGEEWQIPYLHKYVEYLNL